MPQLTLFQGGEDENFDWDEKTQGLIIDSFYYGFCLTQIVGGILAQRYGGKFLFGGGILIGGSLSLLYPWAARTSVVLLMVLRAMQVPIDLRHQAQEPKVKVRIPAIV